MDAFSMSFLGHIPAILRIALAFILILAAGVYFELMCSLMGR
jgi:hypothetical protein